MKINIDKNNAFVFSIVICSTLLGFAFYQSLSLEGGQDTWQHFLISKYALNYPELLIDQWNKPVFTWCTTLFCNLGLNAMVIFNIVSVLLSSIIIAFSLQKAKIKLAWLAIPLICFCPIVLGNTISCLTEPLNMLILSLVLFLWQFEFKKISIIIASFLPYLRTEGFVICGAIFIFIILIKEYSYLPWLLVGSIILNIVGFAITNHPFWIISDNPYLKAELESTFDPGKGNFLHYLHAARQIFGLPSLILFLGGNILFIYQVIKTKISNKMVLLSLLIFWSYFLAHTAIYYLGILGSHGLTRVMAVIVPSMIIVSLYFLSFILEKLNSVHKNIKHVLPIAIALLCIWIGYKETGYAKPYRISEPTVKIDRVNNNLLKAGTWLQNNHLLDRTIIHQSPYFNVMFNKNPYDVKSSYYIWSIDKKNDWAAKGVIVTWEGYYCTREGNMPLKWLQENTNYKLLTYIKGIDEKGKADEMLDIYIFEKIN